MLAFEIFLGALGFALLLAAIPGPPLSSNTPPRMLARFGAQNLTVTGPWRGNRRRP